MNGKLLLFIPLLFLLLAVPASATLGITCNEDTYYPLSEFEFLCEINTTDAVNLTLEFPSIIPSLQLEVLTLENKTVEMNVTDLDFALFNATCHDATNWTYNETVNGSLFYNCSNATMHNGDVLNVTVNCLTLYDTNKTCEHNDTYASGSHIVTSYVDVYEEKTLTNLGNNDYMVSVNSDYATLYLKMEAGVPVGTIGKFSLSAVTATDSGELDPSWLSDFPYRQPINLSVASGATLKDYQVLLVLTSSDVGANYIWSSQCINGNSTRTRFTNGSGDTELKFMVESCSVAGQNMSVWVKIPPNITTTVEKVYMYYGDPNIAAIKGDGADVFDFYDDFSDNYVDNATWTLGKINFDNYANETNQQLHTKGKNYAANYWRGVSWAASTSSFGNANTGWALKANVFGNDISSAYQAYQSTLLFWHNDTSSVGTALYNDAVIYVYQWDGTRSMGNPGNGGPDSDTWYWYLDLSYPGNQWRELELIWNVSDGQIWYFEEEGGVTNHTMSWTTEDLYVRWYLLARQTNDQIEGKLDDVFVRKYHHPEPTYVIGSEETFGFPIEFNKFIGGNDSVTLTGNSSTSFFVSPEINYTESEINLTGISLSPYPLNPVVYVGDTKIFNYTGNYSSSQIVSFDVSIINNWLVDHPSGQIPVTTFMDNEGSMLMTDLYVKGISTEPIVYCDGTEYYDPVDEVCRIGVVNISSEKDKNYYSFNIDASTSNWYSTDPFRWERENQSLPVSIVVDFLVPQHTLYIEETNARRLSIDFGKISQYTNYNIWNSITVRKDMYVSILGEGTNDYYIIGIPEPRGVLKDGIEYFDWAYTDATDTLLIQNVAMSPHVFWIDFGDEIRENVIFGQIIPLIIGLGLLVFIITTVFSLGATGGKDPVENIKETLSLVILVIVLLVLMANMLLTYLNMPI